MTYSDKLHLNIRENKVLGTKCVGIHVWGEGLCHQCGDSKKYLWLTVNNNSYEAPIAMW